MRANRTIQRRYEGSIDGRTVTGPVRRIIPRTTPDSTPGAAMGIRWLGVINPALPAALPRPIRPPSMTTTWRPCAAIS